MSFDDYVAMGVERSPFNIAVFKDFRAYAESVTPDYREPTYHRLNLSTPLKARLYKEGSSIFEWNHKTIEVRNGEYYIKTSTLRPFTEAKKVLIIKTLKKVGKNLRVLEVNMTYIGSKVFKKFNYLSHGLTGKLPMDARLELIPHTDYCDYTPLHNLPYGPDQETIQNILRPRRRVQKHGSVHEQAPECPGEILPW